MSRTPATNERERDVRFVSADTSEPEPVEGGDDLEGGGWARGEGFGSIGPGSFGTPE